MDNIKRKTRASELDKEDTKLEAWIRIWIQDTYTIRTHDDTLYFKILGHDMTIKCLL